MRTGRRLCGGKKAEKDVYKRQDLRTLSLDPHPTPAGHQVMAQTHIPLLEDRLVEIRTAWLKTDLPERQEESRASLRRRLLPPMALLAAVFLLWALLPRRRHI